MLICFIVRATQVNLSYSNRIVGVATQGAAKGENGWIKSYYLKCSLDGVNFYNITESCVDGVDGTSAKVSSDPERIQLGMSSINTHLSTQEVCVIL